MQTTMLREVFWFGIAMNMNCELCPALRDCYTAKDAEGYSIHPGTTGCAKELQHFLKEHTFLLIQEPTKPKEDTPFRVCGKCGVITEKGDLFGGLCGECR